MTMQTFRIKQEKNKESYLNELTEEHSKERKNDILDFIITQVKVTTKIINNEIKKDGKALLNRLKKGLQNVRNIPKRKILFNNSTRKREMAGYRAAVKGESLIMHNYLKPQEKILTAACQQKQ